MPSPRRLRALLYLVLAAVVVLLFFTSQARHSRETDAIRDFYHKTMNGLERDRGVTQQVIPGHDHDADGDIDEDDAIMAKEMAARLKQAEQKAKENANAKAPNKPDDPKRVIGVGSAAGGHKEEDERGLEVEETAEEHEIEVELDSILRKSPVIIFSKSYCPYSKRAKGILLEKYVIEPAPYVVELDLHPLGRKIQDRLAVITKRTTVPNIMIYGKSIGGGDDVAALDADGKLAAKIKDLGGKRVEVSRRFSEKSS
ncbi:thioredoxin-like protein [Triangularia verruculosa]|uniref:Thioredoxin-like protein n=1 Tax=Triangularia verruculosa TaxID=2587418 RepID=A0AAN6XG88_9PEZI|nr:thioredoxin-like protein [Triangularia verruculosa]